MPLLDTPAFRPWRIALTILHIVVICTTTLRILCRHISRQLWYDDYIAIFSVVWDCLFLASLHLWTRGVPNGEMFGKHITIIFYWLGWIAYISVLWSARISLSLALARVFSPSQSIKRFAVWVSWGFLFISAMMLLQFVVACGHNTSWYQSTQVQCKVPKYFGLISFSADLIADVLLIAIPLRSLWKAKLSPHQRHLVLAGLVAGISMSITGAVYFVFVFGPSSWGPPRKTIALLYGHSMASISLLMCNSMALVTFHCRLRKDKDAASCIGNSALRSRSGISSLTSVVLTEVSISERNSTSLYNREPPHGVRYYSEQNLTLAGPGPCKPVGESASI
ncbi:hypothetical protein BD779DRAFT_1052467 [Infundibulicybe gibba]|nr:hypothetical protein BD779DRAFT_1052467 [Infundibulicybe gibba]